ncbi:outer membrane protein [Aquisediminimonas profunda]|uniref:outer membrane protein n=1 Tax=Aquisediminimonas profunda TaxID=1550733 RepID=UPI001C62C97D|nr:outer membrane beta-barrel protein [Aquisediminimonas profunda]
MLKPLSVAVVLATMIATPAFAQGEAPFTGPHVEALAGYEHTGDADGIMYGVAGGVDFQLGGVIAGLEGELSDSTNKGSNVDVLQIGDSTNLKTGRDLYAGARIGFAVSPKTMIYAKGGYTNAKFDARYADATGTVFTQGRTADGYRLGAGIEQKFNLFGPSGFIKAEYRYSNYKNLDVGANDVNIDVDRHQVVVGLGVRF